MSDSVTFLVMLILGLGIGLVIVSPIILIAFVASKSRKKKRQKLIDSLPSGIDFYSAVRINSSKKNDAFFKLTGFECSGILYVYNNKIYFKGTKKGFESLEFDLATAQVFWVGVQVQNGALQWFSINNFNGGERYYFNADTGTTIFKLSKKGDTTKGIYDKILNARDLMNIGAASRREELVGV